MSSDAPAGPTEPAAPIEPAPPALATRVARGMAWKVGSVVFLQGSRFVVAVILAHLLSPHDYGIAGMVLVFSSLLLLFSDLGFGVALIQRKIVTEEDRSTVFLVSLAAGVLFTLVGIAVSGPVADFYGEPRVQPLLAALSVGFVVTAITSTQMALLTREMDFRALELRNMGAAVVSGAVGITLAATGFGPWAIIAQQLAVAATSSVLLWASSSWRPTRRFSLQSLRSMASYSANVFGSRFLFYLNRNADNVLIGRFLGASPLGLYQVSYNLMLVPFNNIAGPVQEVLFPAFSRIQDDHKALSSAWLRANRVVASISMPALLGLMATAPDFVAVVLGHKWDDATPVIEILAWVGLIQSLQGINSTVLRSVDRTELLVKYSIVILIGSLIAFVAGLPFGVVGVAAAYAISSTLLEPYYAYLTAHAVGITLRGALRTLTGVAAAAFAMFVVVLGLRLGLTALDVAPIARLGAETVIGGAAYLLIVRVTAPEVREELSKVKNRLRPAQRRQVDV